MRPGGQGALFGMFIEHCERPRACAAAGGVFWRRLSWGRCFIAAILTLPPSPPFSPAPCPAGAPQAPGRVFADLVGRLRAAAGCGGANRRGGWRGGAHLLRRSRTRLQLRGGRPAAPTAGRGALGGLGALCGLLGRRGAAGGGGAGGCGGGRGGAGVLLADGLDLREHVLLTALGLAALEEDLGGELRVLREAIEPELLDQLVDELLERPGAVVLADRGVARCADAGLGVALGPDGVRVDDGVDEGEAEYTV